MVKMSRDWTGKKNNLPNQAKKEKHQERKTKKEIQHFIEDDDWDQQLKDFYATKSVQEQFQ